jgi:ADP-ribose pyrophosphatase YjhB (NUDIX family)
VQRKNPPSQGSWSLPGGMLGLGELVCDAAVREVLEETGVSAVVGGAAVPGPAHSAFWVTDSIHHDSSKRIQYHYVLCHVLCFADHAAKVVAADDAAAANWFDAAAVAEGCPRLDWRRGGAPSDMVRQVVAAGIALAASRATSPGAALALDTAAR